MNISLRRYLVVLSLLVGSAIPCAANAYNDSVTSECLHREIEEHNRVVGNFLLWLSSPMLPLGYGLIKVFP